MDRWLTQAMVCAITSLSRATIHRWRQQGRFPPPFYVGGRSTVLRWRETDIREWMAANQSAVRTDNVTLIVDRRRKEHR